jgi:hypothetical protein
MNPWTDPCFLENQRRFPRAELLRYLGQHIAWSWDGSAILAAANDSRSLNEKLREAGIDPHHVIYDFVEDPNLSYLA